MHTKDIFYIAGYDPRSYKYYYKTYKTELEKYKIISKENIKISKINKDDFNYFTLENDDLNTKYTFLEWQEIVKNNWSSNTYNILKDYFYIIFTLILSCKFIGFYKAYKTSLIAGFYPIIYITFTYCLTFFIAYLLKDIWPISLLFIYFANVVIMYCGKKFAAFWLLNICVFASRLANNKIKDINNYVDKFANKIINTLKENKDSNNYELILISHSVGTIINILVLSEVIKQCERENISYKNLKIITLGECILLCSISNLKGYFIKELEYLSNKNVFWLDFTSKIDGACFYLCDFFAKSGVKSNKNVLYLSSAFYKLYDKKYYKKIMRKWYQVHFMYLFATHYLGRYDFFAFSTKKSLLEDKLKEEL